MIGQPFYMLLHSAYLMEFPMIMLHWKKKKIAQNFAKTLSASAPVSFDSLVINMTMTMTMTMIMIMTMTMTMTKTLITSAPY